MSVERGKKRFWEAVYPLVWNYHENEVSGQYLGQISKDRGATRPDGCGSHT